MNLQNRLNEFANTIIDLTQNLPKTGGAQYLADQLMQSALVPARYYREVQSANSRNDIIYKMKYSLKELRETKVCLKMIERRNYIQEENLKKTIQENHELVSIYVKNIATARKTM